MARKFSFDPDQYQAYTIAELRHEWLNVPDAEARNVIAVEHQYLDSHRYLLASIRHQPAGGGNQMRIGLSLRAGALKAASLICAAIAEAVLRAHAEARGYALPKKPWQRTFGKVLAAWQDEQEKPLPEVAPIWDELQRLHSGRNNVHLYRVVEDGSDFYDVLEQKRRL